MDIWNVGVRILGWVMFILWMFGIPQGRREKKGEKITFWQNMVILTLFLLLMK